MRCPGCKGDLRVSHTFQAGTGGRTSAARCSSCKKRYIFVTFLTPAGESRGEGAKAVAKRMAQAGQTSLRLGQDEIIPAVAISPPSTTSPRALEARAVGARSRR